MDGFEFGHLLERVLTYFSGNLKVTAALCGVLLSPLVAFSQQTGELRNEVRKPNASNASASDNADSRLFKLSQALLQDPQNPTLMLQKGVLLSEMGQLQAAYEVFNALRQAYPNHPAPYANLASLLARQGRLEEARQMLLKADEVQSNKFQTQLSLASVNLELALSALNKANQLNPGDRTVEARLRMLERYLADVNKGSFPVAAGGALGATAKANELPLSTTGSGRTRLNSAATAKSPRDRLLLGLMDSRDEALKPADPVNDAPGLMTLSGTPDPRKTEVLQTIERWVTAWTKQSLDEYVGLYSTQFVSPDGASRDEWGKRKRALWEKTKSVQVELKISSVKFSGSKATVLLSQKYSSDRYSDLSRKELQFVQEDGRWKILSEKKRP